MLTLRFEVIKLAHSASLNLSIKLAYPTYLLTKLARRNYLAVEFDHLNYKGIELAGLYRYEA